MARLRHDLALALRQLRRAPGWATLIVLSLALGIGGNAAIFRLLDSYVLRPLPFPESERLVRVMPDRFLSAQQVEALQQETVSYRALGAIAQGSVVLEEGGRPRDVPAAVVDAGLFEVLAVAPRLGRTIRPQDTIAGAEPVAVLSHALWQRAFGGRSDVLGRELRMAGEGEERRTVVGVMPEGFRPTPSDADVFLSMTFDPDHEGYDHWVRYWLLGRLARDASAEVAAAEAATVITRLAKERQLFDDRAVEDARVVDYQASWVGEFARRLWLLFAGVGAVLLVACTNVAHLISARLAGRERELAIRSALGAERRDLMGQLLVEAGVLAMAGGALGLALASFGLRIAEARLPGGLPAVESSQLDLRLMVLTAGFSLLAAMLVGLAPAWFGSRTSGSLEHALASGTRTGGSTRRASRASASLVAVEVALCTALLITAGLMLESLRRLTEVDPGFRAERVYTLGLLAPEDEFPDEASRQRTLVALEDAVAALPGVEAVGAINQLPLTRGILGVGISPDGEPVAPGEPSMQISYRSVAPGFRSVLGIPLLEGRDLLRSDRLDSTKVALVNRSLAEALFQGRSAVGERLHWDNGDEWLTVVGVVGDVHQRALDLAPQPEVYVPYAQEAWLPALHLVVRASDELDISALLTATVTEVEPRLVLSSPKTMSEVWRLSTAAPRRYSGLFGSFALLGLLLAALGVFGVTSHAVGRRRHEMGVRAALGARHADLTRHVLLGGMRPVILGLGAGVALALLSTRLLSSMLFEVSPLEPGVVTAVLVLLGAVALAANLLPALRASRVDPIRILKVD